MKFTQTTRFVIFDVVTTIESIIDKYICGHNQLQQSLTLLTTMWAPSYLQSVGTNFQQFSLKSFKY